MAVARDEVDQSVVEQAVDVALRAPPELAREAHRGHLHGGAQAHQACHQIGLVGEPGDQLGVGQDRPPAQDRKLVDQLVGVPRHGIDVQLQEEPTRPGKRQHARGLAGGGEEILQKSPVDVDLAARIERDLAAHLALDPLAQGVEQLDVVVPPTAAALVRRRDQPRAAVARGVPAHGDRFGKILGAVVDAGKEVAVQIDHESPRRQTAGASFS